MGSLNFKQWIHFSLHLFMKGIFNMFTKIQTENEKMNVKLMFSINRFSSYLIFYFLDIHIFQKSNSAHFKATGFPSTKSIFKCRCRLTSVYWAYIFNNFLMESRMISFFLTDKSWEYKQMNSEVALISLID